MLLLRRFASAPAAVKPFDKVLVANRGEIACRVMRTMKKLGVRTVAVYSDADAGSAHVAEADEAYNIGPAPAKQSYLRGDAIIEVARRSGAQAIHPGYGFLSENEEFCGLCERNDIAFIGPPVAAIRAMGSKAEAKKIMIAAGVPCVPGYHGDDQSVERLTAEADKCGYPILIKATMGGGGKGMKIAMNKAEFADALASAKREALSSFKDDRVILERYIVKSRHVEMQVFGDKHGGAVHLFERDCSVQRRHQKIIEEAPAPGLDPALRKRFGEAAVAAAKAVGYVGAGTVEFIMDVTTNEFFFMEMNTRLQVEHPVTEMITGQDLVQWQLQVAAGGRLPLAQSEIVQRGHAFEARIYAENPDANFAPQTGTLRHLSVPKTSETVRVDTGVRQGDSVSIYYDPMIAKLIVWGESRDIALRRLRDALAEYRIVGLPNNVSFLSRLSAHPRFASHSLDLHAGFIAENAEGLFTPPAPAHTPRRRLAVASLFRMLEDRHAALAARARSADPDSPWGSGSGLRLGSAPSATTLRWGPKGEAVRVTSLPAGDFELAFEDGGARVAASATLNVATGDLAVSLDGDRFVANVQRDTGAHSRDLHIFEKDCRYVISSQAPLFELALDSGMASGAVTSDMPGSVIRVVAKEGDSVAKGDPVLILESMKMEVTLRAPKAGKVTAIKCKVGQLVKEKVPLLVIE